MTPSRATFILISSPSNDQGLGLGNVLTTIRLHCCSKRPYNTVDSLGVMTYFRYVKNPFLSRFVFEDFLTASMMINHYTQTCSELFLLTNNVQILADEALQSCYSFTMTLGRVSVANGT